MPPRTKTDAVARRIRRLAREIGPGGRLPGYRELMTRYSVSQSTLAAALRRLEDEGVVETRPSRGVFVTERADVRPILLLCDAASFIGPSPFWELFLEHLVAPFRDRPERIAVEFTLPTLEPRGAVPVERSLSPRLWARLRARRFSGVVAVCVDEHLPWELERLGVPVVGFGCPAHRMIRMGFEEASHLGVAELVRLGCRRIALYNAPHIGAREVFRAALTAHGASEAVVPPTAAFERAEPRLGHRYRLVEHGFAQASRVFGPEAPPEVRPDGVLSVDDMFTQGFLMGLTRLGLAPARDVEIATYVNRGSPALAGWQDAITALEFDPAAIARSLVSAVEALVAGEVPSSDGWERSAMVEERQGPLQTLQVRPRLRPRPGT